MKRYLLPKLSPIAPCQFLIKTHDENIWYTGVAATGHSAWSFKSWIISFKTKMNTLFNRHRLQCTVPASQLVLLRQQFSSWNIIYHHAADNCRLIPLLPSWRKSYQQLINLNHELECHSPVNLTFIAVFRSEFELDEPWGYRSGFISGIFFVTRI